MYRLKRLATVFGAIALLLGGAIAASVPAQATPAGFLIRSDLNGKCLDIQGANPNNSAAVIMYTCHGGANQRWY